MPQPLQPKIRPINTHPLFQHRLAAAERGWRQAYVREKRGGPNWTRSPSDPGSIKTRKEWRDLYFTGTGIILTGNLAAIDIDVSIPAVADRIRQEIMGLDPDAWKLAIHRTSGAAGSAHFFLAEQPFLHFSTVTRYTAHPELIPELLAAYDLPEATDQESDHKAATVRDVMRRLEPQSGEIFGSLARARHMQVEGKHSEGRDYQCGERAPWNTSPEELGRLPASPAAIVDRMKAVLEEMLTAIPEPPAPVGTVFYDLEPDTKFYPKDDGAGTIEDLAATLRPGAENGLRGCLPWTRASRSQANCKLYVTRSGRIVVTDWSHDNATHYMKTEEPPPPFEFDQSTIDTLAALASPPGAPAPGSAPDERAPGEAPPRPPAPPQGTFEQGLAWMLATFAHCKGDVIMPIYDVDPGGAMSVREFHNRYQKYSMPKPSSPSGALAYATRVWMGHPEMRDIDGYDMRPDMPWPLFIEDGKIYKNTWRPPHHVGEGETDTWDDFMRHLLPAAVEEAAFHDVVSHKTRHPEVPGQAVIMVAESGEQPGDEVTGTGRGTLFKILEKLFGWRYAKRVDYELFAGVSGQATFTDWQADLAMAFIEEGKETGTTRYSESRSVYEHTKSMIDLAPRRATVRAKYGKPRDATLNCSFLIATNHGNAFRIPDSDRRFLILSNGARMSEKMAQRMYAWMAKPGNIAALWRKLRARDISQYNPMNPPLITEARRRMVEQATSEIDVLMREALSKMQGIAFTRTQVMDAVRGLASNVDMLHSGNGAAQLASAFRRMTMPLAIPGDAHRMPRRFRLTRVTGQERGYAKTMAHAAQCDGMDHDAVRAEIEKNGVLDIGSALAKGLRVVGADEPE